MSFCQHGNPHNDKRIQRLLDCQYTLGQMMDLLHDEFTFICPEEADNPEVYANLVGVEGVDDENIANYELGKLIEIEMGCPISDIQTKLIKFEYAVQRLGMRLQDEVAREKGLIYLVGNKEKQILKIGYTKNLEQRLNHLNYRSAYAYELIKTKAGNRATEKKALENARKFRLGNELFVWDDSIIRNFDYN